MMRYRITKYNPAHRDAQGVYLLNEWMSCSDIGSVFDGRKLVAEEYLAVEDAYINAIRVIAEVNRCTLFRVRQVERLFSVWETSRKMKRLGLPLTQEELELYRAVDLQSTFTMDAALSLSRMILRELLWATLYDAEEKVSFTFGYDYYLYADCPLLPDEAIGQIESRGLFVEEYD